MPTALLSVYDKTGIVELAAGLRAAGWRLVSSGGTAKAIADAGLDVTDLADLTGLPAILDHRVVTLHPKVHGGLLADPTNPTHQADMAEHGIEPIDLVVVNLYPFASNPSIELIDIGGPAMVRAAAKNHAHVAVVVNPADYRLVLDEVAAHGRLSSGTRRRLARDAFATIAAYDAAIANWFDAPSMDSPDELPAGLHLSLERAQTLRYGENPHQQGARYRFDGATSWWDTAVQHQGKELSYLNLYDTEAAWKLVQRFGRPACVIVKHANPCGVAVAESIEHAYVAANSCDPVSAFGGIVALNRPCTAELAESLAPVFTEVVVAPSYSPEALAVFAKDGQAYGIGAGQQNRVDSARIAATRAAGRAAGGVCASDAFFPFRDTLDVAAEAGITAIIQPGGSVRDPESIAAADEYGIAMVFTGERHFRH